MAFVLSSTLTGHELDVRAVLSPSETTILSAARDKTVRSWTREDQRAFAEDKVYLGHQNYVNALAFIPPSEDNPEGLIVSSGSDKLINIFDPQNAADPIFSMVGHAENVCALDVTPDGKTIVSGSWDKTIKVWRNWQCQETLEGHTQAVWAVLLLEDGVILSASADKTIKLWQKGRCVKTFTGHTDVVRGLARVPGIGFVSCSNDSTLRLWSLSGECLQEMSGHTSFVYSVALLPSGEIVSSGEDRSVRVWKDGELIQTILQPCISVWCVTTLANGDIACGGSDGVVRTFSRDKARAESAAAIKAFDEAVAAHAIPSNQIGDLNKEKLPGIEALQVPGKKEGEVKMVRVGNMVEAHQWSSNTQSWQKVGEVVDAVGSNRKQVYDGREYDYVFDIDIGDGVMLKLPYNVTQNPWTVAQEFIWKHELPQAHLDEVANFISQNTQGAQLGMASNEYSDPFTGAGRYVPSAQSTGQSTGANYGDPFTGAGRYIPGASSAAQNTGTGNADPFTGAGRYVPGPQQAPSPSPSANAIPQKTCLPLKQASLTGIQKKLGQLNDELTANNPGIGVALSQDEISSLNQGIQLISTSSPSSDASMLAQSLPALMKILQQWPVGSRFPALDLLRLYVLYDANGVASALNNDIFVPLLELAGLHTDSEIDKVSETNFMLIVRCWSNVICSAPDLIRSALSKILPLIAARWSRSSTKNTRLALATLWLNFAVIFDAQVDEEYALEVVSTLIQFLQVEEDPENTYRALVALGTLVVRSTSAKEAAGLLDGKAGLQALAQKWSSDKRIATVAGQLSQHL